MGQVKYCSLLILVVTAVATITDAEIQDRRCLAGFFRIDNHCFKAVSPPLSWKGSKEACRVYGGHLAAPLNVLKLQKELHTRYGAATFWLGGTDEAEEGNWRWITGGEIDAKYWMPNQPNNCCGGENCLSIGTAWAKPLNDNRCTNKRKYVCQVHVLPPMYS